MLSLLPSAEQWLCVSLLLFYPYSVVVREGLLFLFAKGEIEA